MNYNLEASEIGPFILDHPALNLSGERRETAEWITDKVWTSFKKECKLRPRGFEMREVAVIASALLFASTPETRNKVLSEFLESNPSHILRHNEDDYHDLVWIVKNYDEYKTIQTKEAMEWFVIKTKPGFALWYLYMGIVA